MKTIWTEKEIEYLKNNYSNKKSEEIMSFLSNKSLNQIRRKASDFGLKKMITRSKADMTFLLNFDNPIVLYWWGFITSDGCINERSIIIAVHENDINHLKKFCELSKSKISKSTRINSWHKEPYTMVRTAIEDKYTLPIIKETLKIKNQKTYNPLDVSIFLNKNRLIYFLAGLIDGDGYIGNAISIKCHPNWHQEFLKIKDSLLKFYNIDSSVTIQKDGWLVLRICGKKQLLSIYEMIKNKIPYMERKWFKLSNVN